MDYNKIDKGLAEAMAQSPWLNIPYDSLMETNPQGIRDAEARLASEEEPLDIPNGLIVENRIISGYNNSPDIRVRIYRPKSANNIPVMLYFHGGAFIFGSPEQMDFVFYHLAIDANIAIVSVDYRLAPEHPFPVAIEDAYASLMWLSNHASEINVDINKIIVGGSSAGGTLAIAMTHRARDLNGPAIKFQFLLYPPTDYRLATQSMKDLADAPMQTRKSATLMWKHYLGENTKDVSSYASPMEATDFTNLPQAYIMVCEFDPLRDEGIAYAQKLIDAGVTVELDLKKGAIHTFDYIPCAMTDRFYEKQVQVLKNISF